MFNLLVAYDRPFMIGWCCWLWSSAYTTNNNDMQRKDGFEFRLVLYFLDKSIIKQERTTGDNRWEWNGSTQTFWFFFVRATDRACYDVRRHAKTRNWKIRNIPIGFVLVSAARRSLSIRMIFHVPKGCHSEDKLLLSTPTLDAG